jgi:hypothetical protein
LCLSGVCGIIVSLCTKKPLAGESQRFRFKEN